MSNPTQQAAKPRRSPLSRLGCAVALILWFTLLLSPCFMIVLATRGEISVTTGPAPEQRVRIWLIQEADQSGIGISSGTMIQHEDEICVQTDVNFVLWQGEAQPVQYCECYIQAKETFQLTDVTQAACQQP